MRKNVLHRCKIYSIFALFMAILISCENSTSPSVINSAPNKEIIGKWTIYKKCVEFYGVNEAYVNFPKKKIGEIDTLYWEFSEIDLQENMILACGFESKTGITFAWVSSMAVSEAHWMLSYLGSNPYVDNGFQVNIEFTETNPLRGTWTYKMYNKEKTKLIAYENFELSGVKQ